MAQFGCAIKPAIIMSTIMVSENQSLASCMYNLEETDRKHLSLYGAGRFACAAL